MFYYLYQITNKVNNKIYVGVHETNNLDDGYMGSGKVIKSAIQKHGVLNFEKVIFEHFENQEAMYAIEAEIVNEEFLLREDVYNLACGGSGGSIKQNRKPFRQQYTQQTKDKISASNMCRITSDETSQKIKDNLYKTRSKEEHRLQCVKNGQAPKSDSHKNNISLSLVGRKKKIVSCPHCDISGGVGIMNRWHFDNCKQRSMVLVA